jgi:RimJ/RimL family protein N-acetyltransferase
LEYGFHTIGLKEIVAFTAPQNVRSRAVMKRIGMTCDAQGDFNHPLLPEGHPLQRHVLYRAHQ